MYWRSPLILQEFSFACCEIPSPQRNYSERSLSQRRALAISITSPRQLVESKGAVQSIPTCASESAHMRLGKCPHAPWKVPACNLVNPHVRSKNESQKAQIMMIIIDIQKKICIFVANKRHRP